MSIGVIYRCPTQIQEHEWLLFIIRGSKCAHVNVKWAAQEIAGRELVTLVL